MTASLGEWPFPDRRCPRPDQPDYLPLRALSLALQATIKRELSGRTDLRIVDVGCGQKPFYPFFVTHVQEYVGLDIDNAFGMTDRVCPAEHLAVDSGWADVTLCLSVLEHVDDPPQVIRELTRVTKVGGVVFAATHGCFPWHPHPQDHWRWTQTGLRLLFQRNGDFRSIDITATHGSVAHIFFLLAHYFSEWCEWSRWRRPLRAPLLRLINRTGERLDRRFTGLADINRRVTAIPEFFVTARR